MLSRTGAVTLCLAAGLAAGAYRAGPAQPNTHATLREQVVAAETAFAQTMIDRDLRAFASFLSADAIFVGSQRTFRGREQVSQGWKPYFQAPDAPFSWRPEQVEVLDSGDLALSSGPVFGPQGKLIGTFNSIWRRGSDGTWRVVFDKGCDVCDGD
jgi:ketosteroid isomerase-like protein